MYLQGTFKKQDLEEKARRGKDSVGLSHSSSPSLRQSHSKDDKRLLDLVTGCSKSQRLRADLRQKSPEEPKKFKVAQDNRF